LHCLTCWLITYPVAGWFGAKFGLSYTFWVLGGIAITSIIIAKIVWPASDDVELEHEHKGLAEDHPHILEHQLTEGKHIHSYVIDDLHQRCMR
jgi:predicted MFS family arabinose efflux permease